MCVILTMASLIPIAKTIYTNTYVCTKLNILQNKSCNRDIFFFSTIVSFKIILRKHIGKIWIKWREIASKIKRKCEKIRVKILRLSLIVVFNTLSIASKPKNHHENYIYSIYYFCKSVIKFLIILWNNNCEFLV